ncbi:MAG: aldo/keto reductase [Euzebyales bacterium]|jgi:aryl-alcohol dehydrogenase-like predicted oxidoreductase|nr:aldo/keto reductase [Euzebyales bacterium]
MQTRTIAGRTVSAIGLGGMPMSLEGSHDEDQSIRTIHAALDAGVRLIDTADAYCENEADTGHNERLIAAAVSQWSGDASEVLVATKGGHTRTADGGWEVDGRPEHLRSACEASLKALGVDVIGLYQYHRPDPEVPYAESVGTLRELQEEGKIQLAGISNASVEQIREAMSILPLASVQNEFSPRFRGSEDELAFCDEHGIAFLPWSPLGGIGKAKDLGPSHSVFAGVAEERGVSPHQVALAWELAKAPVVIPIPGASRPETIRDSLQAVDLELTPDELARLDEASGTRLGLG